MSPTLERLRKLKKEPPIKPKQVRPRTGNFPRLIINLPPDVILVLIGLLLLRSRLCLIFIPPQDVTPQDLKSSSLSSSLFKLIYYKFMTSILQSLEI